jgi:Zn-dependent protease with chaperone function
VRLRLLGYGAPIGAGLVLVAFLLKPFFSKAVRADEKRALAKSEAPLLFILVREIAQAAGAPVPDRIEIDCDVNASAGRLKGEDGRRLVLTIGLPLVAGLELRQLAGVLAHEFGHFSQGAGMRLSGRIRSMNFWFYRLVYERDSFDEGLASARAEESAAALVAGLASLGVWVSRGLLWVMMQIGHAISCSFMRQMEFDADRYEIALAGSGTFAATARDLGLLNYATQLAFGELEEAWREGRLGDDLPRLISSKASALPADVKKAVEQQILSDTTGIFDTHPSDRDRIVRAQQAKCAGSFDLDAPAVVVFSDFDALCRELTLGYYEEELGPNVRGTTLVSTSDLMEHRDRLSAEEEAVARYFPRLIPWARSFALAGDAVPRPERPKEIAARLRTLRAEIGSRIVAGLVAAAEPVEQVLGLAQQSKQGSG